MRRNRMIAGGVVGLLLMAAACTGNAEQGLDLADTASGIGGHLQLQQASAAASLYFGTNGTYVGFNAAAGESTEPAIQWMDGGTATNGAVSIRGATPTSVVLVTSDAGVTVNGSTISCLGLNSGIESKGSQDAQNAAGCSGGW